LIKALFDVSAPAKLNLFLHVTGRRADGYHLIQSVFMLIDWCDTLHFDLRTDGQISREDLGSELPEEDLIVRAARALQTAGGGCQGTGKGAHIGVQKRIPSQAGMGGGSSDAASTLLALNRLWQLDLPLSELARIGLGLGADVPFFLYGRNAWVEGVGEQITPVTLPDGQFVVAKPPDGVQTAAIFQHRQLKRDTPTAIISGFAEHPFDFGHNDLQAVAQSICPSISLGLDWMTALDNIAAKPVKGRMTGSGSAIFAHVSGKRRSSEPRVGWPAPPEGFEIRLCNNLQVHPLLGWAKFVE
jgi:4-diphosphocytidyl-2-C-methyl-D-erythritol kinase